MHERRAAEDSFWVGLREQGGPDVEDQYQGGVLQRRIFNYLDGRHADARLKFEGDTKAARRELRFLELGLVRPGRLHRAVRGPYASDAAPDHEDSFEIHEAKKWTNFV